jgi:hypothetical protein
MKLVVPLMMPAIHWMRLAVRFQHQFLGDAATADQFNDDVDVGIGDYRESVVRQLGPTGRDLPRQFKVLVRHLGDSDRPSGTAGDLGLVARKNAKRSAADGTDAKESYIDGFHFKVFLKLKAGITRPSRK